LEIQTDRRPAMEGINQIPFSAICKYAEAFDFTGDELDDLIYFVRELDDEYMTYFDEQKKSTQKPKGKGKGNNTITF